MFTDIASRSRLLLYGTGGGGLKAELTGLSKGLSLDGDEENTWGVILNIDEELSLGRVVMLGTDEQGPLLGDLPPVPGWQEI